MPWQKAKFEQRISASSKTAEGLAQTLDPCPPACRPLIRAGFTLVELLVVIAILAILLSLILGALARARASASAVACCANLRQIGVAFQLYAGDNAGRLPDPTESGISWETAIRFCNSNVLRCPADDEIYSALGSSYDWRDTGDPRTTLAGRTMAKARSDAVLAFETLPGWHNRKKMNAVRVDGSALIMEEKDCLGDLQVSPMRAVESEYKR
jgi:prepilin-type N-terminal cleavage/methylation domain-containing protein